MYKYILNQCRFGASHTITCAPQVSKQVSQKSSRGQLEVNSMKKKKKKETSKWKRRYEIVWPTTCEFRN